jgi:hypothetical protein
MQGLIAMRGGYAESADVAEPASAFSRKDAAIVRPARIKRPGA